MRIVFLSICGQSFRSIRMEFRQQIQQFYVPFLILVEGNKISALNQKFGSSTEQRGEHVNCKNEMEERVKRG